MENNSRHEMEASLWGLELKVRPLTIKRSNMKWKLVTLYLINPRIPHSAWAFGFETA